MDWFRHYHGLCTDPKLHKVARSAGVSRGLVIAAWCALLESASSSNERGRIDDMDGVSLGFLIDVKPHIATRILTAIQAAKMVDEDGRIAAWDRRQRGSDDAAGRKRIQRDRERETNPLKTPQSDSSCHATNPSRVEKNRVDKKENPLPPSEPQPSLLPAAEASVDPKPAKRSAKVEYPEAFERLWRAYPVRDEDRASKRDIFRSWRTVTQSNDPESLIRSAERWHAEQHDNDCRFGLRGWLSKGRYLQLPPPRRTQAMLGPRYETSGDVAIRAVRDLMRPPAPNTVIPFPFADGAFDVEDSERDTVEGAYRRLPNQTASRL